MSLNGFMKMSFILNIVRCTRCVAPVVCYIPPRSINVEWFRPQWLAVDGLYPNPTGIWTPLPPRLS
ncbi:hypothetical protein HanXRQr2_Chr14g0637101 [Helianthus annuus]|uniref:Secreted protein n=1 Tax=Helianthus annuus TaxID=4232 RepID=A0A9K3H750_HELAN|nr:hypothetical protein HanXRQr2_Chr14g0637101 [Helianthus annuus]